MNRRVGDAFLFLGDEESSGVEVPGGIVEVRSVRSPDKRGDDQPNEDAAAVIPFGKDALVLAVADGVGGSPSGCDASTTAMQTLADGVSAVPPDKPLRGTILDAIEKANETILASGKRSATTLVIAEISARQLRCYHVVDSELIMVGQRGAVKQRIIPHSPTGFALEAGFLDEAEAVQHEQRHIIFNSVGSPEMRVDISTPIAIAPRDTVLLTSDGVLDNLYFDEIVSIIRAGPLDRAADRLVEAARVRMATENGNDPSKPDDATIVLYRRRAG